ncbi:hypothetical protein D3C79_1003410 [compost metagenome]
MAAQVDFAHPALCPGRNAQRLALVIAQGLPAFMQRGHAEMLAGQVGEAASQRALVEQPAQGRLVELGRQL